MIFESVLRRGSDFHTYTLALYSGLTTTPYLSLSYGLEYMARATTYQIIHARGMAADHVGNLAEKLCREMIVDAPSLTSVVPTTDVMQDSQRRKALFIELLQRNATERKLLRLVRYHFVSPISTDSNAPDSLTRCISAIVFV